MTRRQPEEELQQALADFLRMAHPRLLWWHTVNEGRNSVAWNVKQARAGKLAGVPDLTFVFASGRAGFIELKAAKGRLSTAQRAFRDAAVARGAYWALCRSVASVQATLSLWRADSAAEIEIREMYRKGVK